MNKKDWKTRFEDLQTDILVIAALIIFLYMGSQKGAFKKETDVQSDEIPLASVFITEEMPVEKISDWAVSNDLIYVFYSSHSRIDAFTKEGNYSFSIQLPNYKNGIGGIGVKENLLYAQDKNSNIHIFEGKDYIGSVSKSMTTVDVDELESKDGYRLSFGHIIDVQNNKTVVDLRLSSVYMNYARFFLIFGPLILYRGAICNKKKRSRSEPVLYEQINPLK